MTATETLPQKRLCLKPYWLGLLAYLLILAGYIALIETLHTETATRATAPPWYAWFQRPRVPTVWPLVVFAGWMSVVRWMTAQTRKTWIVLCLACLFVFAMNETVATLDGRISDIWKPFDRPGAEYVFDVANVSSIRTFLHDYAIKLPGYTLHTRTHPPGAVLLLYVITKIFGPGIPIAGWAAVAIAATGPIPAYFLARRVAGESAAAVLLAIYAVCPGLVIFGATSMDGVFVPFVLWAAYFLHRAIEDRSFPVAVVAGIVLFVCFLLTYATICIVGLMILFAPAKPKSLWTIAVALAVPALCFIALYLATGCNILSCLAASRASDHYTMQTYALGFPRYLDIGFDNLFAFLVGVGFAGIALWFMQTKEKPDALNVALIGSLLFFSFAKIFTHETERVWMWLYPIALIAPARWIASHEKRPLLNWTMGLLFAQTLLSQWLLFTIW
jgi:Dolichyl-phosphate-mannose-protein mannosyltransferase